MCKFICTKVILSSNKFQFTNSSRDWRNYYHSIQHCASNRNGHNPFWDTYFITTKMALDILNLKKKLYQNQNIYSNRDCLCELLSNDIVKFVWLPIYQSDFVSLVRCGDENCKTKTCQLKLLHGIGDTSGIWSSNITQCEY